MTWKYDDCRCGFVKMKEKDGEGLKDGIGEYEIINGYHVRSDEIEKRNNEIYKSDVE